VGESSIMDTLEVDTSTPSAGAPLHASQRYCLVQERPVAIGRLKVSRDGVLADPDGRIMRQLPITPAAHGTTHWASEEGVVRALYRADRVDAAAWRWGEALHPSRSGLYSVGTPYAGGRQRHVRPARAAALAWVEVPPHLRPSDACAALVDARAGLRASNLGWFSRRHLHRTRSPLHPGTPSASEDEDSDEEWRPVRYAVRQHGITRRRFRSHHTGDMWISRSGLLRNAEGENACSEPGEPNGEPVVLLPGVGSVPCADVVWQTFASTRPRRLEAHAVDGDPGFDALQVRHATRPVLRKAEQDVYTRFANGRRIEEIARDRGSTEGTVRVHLQRALSAVDPTRVPDHVWMRLLPPCVRHACASTAAREGVDAFATALRETREAIEAHMTPHDEESWRAMDADRQWAALRFAVAFVNWGGGEWERLRPTEANSPANGACDSTPPSSAANGGSAAGST
jgi:DNA-binding CsgD family transcriptional regulator